MGLSGNLFQQKTKAKPVSDRNGNYALTAFHYIHQNPWKAGLVKKMEDWEFSSFKDYAGLRNGKLCERLFAIELLGLNSSTFYKDSYHIIDDSDPSKLFE